jgi:hypothetical protein
MCPNESVQIMRVRKRKKKGPKDRFVEKMVEKD